MGKRTHNWSAALALAAAVLGAGVPPARADTIRADIKDYAFMPERIVVAVGDQVRWTNRGDRTHTVMADDKSFGDDDIDPDESYTKTFRTPGRFPYRCTRHSQMTGTVEVGDQTGASLVPSPGTPTTTTTTRPSTTTSVPRSTTTRPADRPAESQPPAPVQTTGPPSSAPRPTPSTAAPRVATTMPVLRSSTTSTLPAPVFGAEGPATPGEPPLLTPLPGEFSAPVPPGTPTDVNAGRVAAGPVSGDHIEDRGWAPTLVLALVALALAAGGVGGRLLLRRRRLSSGGPPRAAAMKESNG